MLRPLTRADVEGVFAVLRDAPRFHLLTTGATATMASAWAVFDDLPPGKRPDSKRVYGVLSDGGDEFIGVVEVIVGWPTPTTAMIGLLVLRESSHGKGVGRAVVEDLEAVIDDEGCDVARVAVVDKNEGALAFWRAVGFRESGQTRPYAAGTVKGTVIVLEKNLTSTPE